MAKETTPRREDMDAAWKAVLELAPKLVLEKLWPEFVGQVKWNVDIISLDTELHRIMADDTEGVRRADRLLQFKKPKGDPLYLYIEIHCYYDKELGRRVMTCRHRLRAKYGKPVVTLIIFGDPGKKWRPKEHREGEPGLDSEDTCTWHAVKLLDFEEMIAALEMEENIFCLFLAAHLLARPTRNDLAKRAEHKLRLLSNLESRKVEDGAAWYTAIDTILYLPPELNAPIHAQILAQRKGDSMPYISFAEQQGFDKGIEKGREQGIEKGRVIGQIQMCQDLLSLAQTSDDELSRLDLAELQRRAQQLRGQLSPKSNGTQANP